MSTPFVDFSDDLPFYVICVAALLSGLGSSPTRPRPRHSLHGSEIPH